ncbi:hypothetical protein ABPG72_002893 [Tetrahymena utriculariae]
MGCIQSENALQTGINSQFCSKSEIAQLINEQYDIILADLQRCRKQIQQKTGFEMNDHILGFYQQDQITLSSYQAKQANQNDLNEIQIIIQKLKQIFQKYKSVQKQLNYYFDSNEQHYHYYLSLQWKDQVLSNYFYYNILNQSQSLATNTSFSLFSPPNSSERTSLTSI